MNRLRNATGWPHLAVRRAANAGGHRAILTVGHVVLPCALGAGGMSVAKREGDGATPAGILTVTGGYCDPSLRRRLGVAWLKPHSRQRGWCDDPHDASYNRPVRLPYRGQHEKLVREDGLYDICCLLDWNVLPRIRNRGSAIFLHIAAPGLRPTRGCIALERCAMERLVRWIRPGTRILVLK